MKNPILEYLENPYMEDVDVSDTITPGSISFTDEDVAKINRIGSYIPVKEYVEPKQPKRLRNGQVWTVKKSYINGYGDEIKTPFLFIVMIMGSPFVYRGVKFLNVVTITPHVEMSMDDDIVVLDKSLMGFEFMIETWNQQSLRADVLDKYQFTYNLDKHNPPAGITSELSFLYPNSDKIEFRSLEIRNAGYLTHSAWSHIPE